MTPSDDRRPPVDPDPLSVALVVLGALGSIASLITLVPLAVDRRQERKRKGREIGSLTLQLEAQLRQLEGHLRALQTLFTAYGARPMPERRPIGFGRSSFPVHLEELRAWQRVEAQVWQAASKAQRSFQEILLWYAASGTALNGNMTGRLGADLNQLNDLLTSIGQLDGEELLTRLAAIISSIAEAIHMINRDAGSAFE